MEVIFALPILMIPFLFPLVTGLMAVGFRRRFWPWFFTGLALPMVAMIILLCLPDIKPNGSLNTQPA